MATTVAQAESLKIDDLFGVAGKTVFISGGSRGIGRMMAEGFARNGASVYISARKQPQVEQTVDELSAFGQCEGIPGDLSTAEGRKAVVDEIKKRTDSLDVLINNAGAAWGAPFKEYPEDGYDKVMDINVKSVFMMTRDLLPLLEAAAKPGDPARVINIGSIDGLHVPSMDNYAYPPSKAAVHHMTRVFAVRFGRRGITFNAVAPGPFESKMTEWMLGNYQEQIESSCPLGRIGSPPDMAGVALFLASRAGAYVNGAVIPVDGGICISNGGEMRI